MKLRTFVLVASPLDYNERKVFTLRNIFANPTLRGTPPQRPKNPPQHPAFHCTKTSAKKAKQKFIRIQHKEYFECARIQYQVSIFPRPKHSSRILRVCKVSLSNALACDFWFKTESKMLKLFLFGKLAFSCAASI